MTTDSNDAQDAERYRVYLLRLWRDTRGPWHAALQAPDAPTPHRFADLEGLIAFLRDLLRPAASTSSPVAPAAAAAASGNTGRGRILTATWRTRHASGNGPHLSGVV